VTAASRTDLARCGVGVGIRKGAAKPDIKTPAALKQTLLNAKSITYVTKGASRHTIEAMLTHLGIADQMKAKTRFAPASEAAGESVANGHAELLITLVSEIVTVPGVELVGPLPSEVQGYINFAAGVGANAKNADAANKVIGFLSSSAAAPTYKAGGMEVH
jgi:molybdate transport system substrate-binding protein